MSLNDCISQNFTTNPIDSVEDLLSYRPKNSTKRFVSRQNRRRRDRRQLLVCHDMRGNYLSDRYNYGSIYDHNAFEIMDWDIVDIYCYFSHHLVTIVPQAWVNTCRRHDAVVIGTFITEWDAGTANCVALFSNPETAIATADALVAVAMDNGMDGWLINIENALPYPELVKNILIFLSILTKKMREACGETSEVIWYDAVTMEGELQWQDGLTQLNKPFFDCCDGIFINYTWKNESLSSTIDALSASDRPEDIFYGIDVFGRGCVGGGGFNCCEAIHCLSLPRFERTTSVNTICSGETRRCSFSVAIFAPGWILETQVGYDEADETCCNKPLLQTSCRRYRAIRKAFYDKSLRFWNLIRDAWLAGTKTQTSKSPSSSLSYIYYSTLFSSSSGVCIFVNGVPHSHWSSVSLQPGQTQCEDIPSAEVVQYTAPFYDLSMQDMGWIICDNDRGGISLCDDTGWEGTGCLLFTRSANAFVQIPVDMTSFQPMDNIYDSVLTVKVIQACDSKYMFQLTVHIVLEFETSNCEGKVADSGTRSLQVEVILREDTASAKLEACDESTFVFNKGQRSVLGPLKTASGRYQSSPNQRINEYESLQWVEIVYDFPMSLILSHVIRAPPSPECTTAVISVDTVRIYQVSACDSYCEQDESGVCLLGSFSASLSRISSVLDMPVPLCVELDNIAINSLCHSTLHNRIEAIIRWDGVQLRSHGRVLPHDGVHAFCIFNHRVTTKCVEQLKLNTKNFVPSGECHFVLDNILIASNGKFQIENDSTCVDAILLGTSRANELAVCIPDSFSHTVHELCMGTTSYNVYVCVIKPFSLIAPFHNCDSGIPLPVVVLCVPHTPVS